MNRYIFFFEKGETNFIRLITSSWKIPTFIPSKNVGCLN